MAEEMLNLKSIRVGLDDLNCDVRALRDTFDAQPELNQDSAIQALDATYSSLRREWRKANLPSSHPLKVDLAAFSKTFNQISADVATTKARSAPCPSILSSSFSSREVDCDETCRIPKIGIPTFHGDIMQWSSFWAQFSATIDSHERLSDVRKLVYLRKAIKDPDTRALLDTGDEKPGMYQEIVAVLKERFNRTREVHRNLSQRLIQLGNVKPTRTDLRKFVETARTTITSLKHSGHYDLDAFLTSILYLNLPVKLQTLWEQHSRKDKGVPPVQKFLTFISDHAETLPATLPNPGRALDPQEKKSPKKPDRRQDSNSYKHKTNIHVATPAPTYKWKCSLCKPEKHPLFLCPKWQAFTVAQRLSRIQAKNLCKNCLAVGHNTADCRSTYKCRDCGQSHHTSIHQSSSPATPINSSTPMSHQVPDALMMTAQVLISGPGGQKTQARALIDPGAAMTLISSRITQHLHLPLTKANLAFSGVQGTPCKPAKHLTQLVISPLQVGEPQVTLTAAVVSKVTDDLPVQETPSVDELPHLQGLDLADPFFHRPGRIDILLGADAYPELMVQDHLVTGPVKTPAVQRTIFGWAIVGPVSYTAGPSAPIPTHFALGQAAEDDLGTLLSQFWESEEPERAIEALSPVKEIVQAHTLTLYLILPPPAGIR